MGEEITKVTIIAIVSIAILIVIATYVNNVINPGLAAWPWPVDPSLEDELENISGKFGIVTNNKAGQYRPDIYENTVVWVDNRNSLRDNIYLRNLSERTERRLASHPSGQSDPSIYGNIVVWQDYRNGQNNSDIYMLDITDPLGTPPTRITTELSDQVNPVIYKDIIVWESYDVLASPNIDIFMHDLKDPLGVNTQVTNTPNIQEIYPDVYEDYIVFQTEIDPQYHRYNISVYSISNGTSHLASPSSNYQNTPAIDNYKIVWAEGHPYQGIKSNIYMLDLKQPGIGKKQLSFGNQNHSFDPAIHGDRIVWETSFNAGLNIDLFMHNLADPIGQNYRISGNPSHQVDPAIYGNRIVWTDYRNSNPPDFNTDIYMFEVL